MTRPTAMYLIDTNIVSELAKTRAAPGVLAFIADAAAANHPTYLSVISVGEIEFGIARLQHRGDLQQADRYAAFAVELRSQFADRILGIDQEVASVWGRIRVPNAHSAVDKLIAATAYVFGLIVVTRNESDFAGIGVPVLNPFL